MPFRSHYYCSMYVCWAYNRLYHEAPGGVTRTECFAYVDGGRLIWSRDARKRLEAGRWLALHDITDIYVGKQTMMMQSLVAKEVNEHACFSIIAGAAQANFQCVDVRPSPLLACTCSLPHMTHIHDIY
jgi:hypothetical protein